jgi:hypothetical protein
MVSEGLRIVKAISGRYDGVRRNPWNQIEWGNHYSRAMASYSLLLALSGFHYSAVERKLGFRPTIHQENFRCFFAAGSAWGVYSQQQKTGTLHATLECLHGGVTLQHVFLGYGTKAFAKATVLAANGKQIRCSLKSGGGSHELMFMDEWTLREGESVTVT